MFVDERCVFFFNILIEICVNEQHKFGELGLYLSYKKSLRGHYVNSQCDEK